jgi:heptose I phosphotransferase
MRNDSKPNGGLSFETWDAGRLQVNSQFREILKSNGLTTFAALYELPGGDLVRAIDNRRTTRNVLTTDGQIQAFYLKRHGPPRLLDRIRPLLHFSLPILGARHEWEAILRFHARGIPTMTPVAFGEFQSRSFVMTCDLRTDLSLLDWVNSQQPSSRVRMERSAESTRRVAHIARRMHDSGLHHQDFYLNHMLCCGDPAGLDIRVIDLGRVRSRPRLSRRWIIKDLAQLDFSARKLSCNQRLRFLRLYLGRPFRPGDRCMIRQIVLKSRHIAAHTAKNDL